MSGPHCGSLDSMASRIDPFPPPTDTKSCAAPVSLSEFCPMFLFPLCNPNSAELRPAVLWATMACGRLWLCGRLWPVGA